MTKHSERPSQGADFKKGMKLIVLNGEEKEQLMNYTPLCNEVIDFEKIKLSSNFGVKKYKDSTYCGEIIDSMRHGFGIITYTNTRVYEGQWY